MKKVFLFSIVILAIATTGSFAHAATSWYLPEGSTQTNSETGDQFILWILVTNPNDSNASIKLTFYKGSGGTEIHTATVSANSRWTYRVNDLIQNEAISTKVECTNGLNIYAERAMYWGSGGHTSRGISSEEGAFYEISQPALQTDFPITISSSGSYKLTSNITCSTNNVNVIEITASNVTMDLNGFTITGPGGGSSNGVGIYAHGSASAPLRNINITNGGITNCYVYGIGLEYCREFNINSINAYSNGAYGIACPTGTYSGIIQNCTASNNGLLFPAGGFYIGDYTIIKNCVAYNNTTRGFYIVGGGNYAYGNISNGNTYGIYVAGDKNRIEKNHCMGNTDTQDMYFNGNSNLCINNSIDSGVTNSGNNNRIGTDDMDKYTSNQVLN